MKSLSLLAAIAGLSMAITPAAVLEFDANLFGVSEVPPNASPATGFAQIWYDTSTDTLDYKVTFSDLLGGLTGASFQKAPAGANGPIALSLALGGAAGTTLGVFNGTGIGAPAGLLTDLEAGNIYANLRSTVFPAGEIRGQFSEVTAAVPEPTTWAGAAVVVSLISASRRRRR